MTNPKQLADRIRDIYATEDDPIVKRALTYLALLMFEQDVRAACARSRQSGAIG